MSLYALQSYAELLSAAEQLQAENARLKEVMFRLYNVCGLGKYERGNDEPMLADGVYDKVMDEANALLQDYVP